MRSIFKYSRILLMASMVLNLTFASAAEPPKIIKSLLGACDDVLVWASDLARGHGPNEELDSTFFLDRNKPFMFTSIKGRVQTGENQNSARVSGNKSGTLRGLLGSFEFAATTDAGAGRKYNGDNFDAFYVGVDSRDHLILMSIDGMGRAKVGSEVASDTIARFTQYSIERGSDLATTLSRINTRLSEVAIEKGSNQDRDLRNMGAAVVSAEISKNEVRFRHLGDSKGLLIRNQQLLFATKDHSVTQRYIDAGRADEIEALPNKVKSAITKVFGLKEGQPLEHMSSERALSLQPGDRIVLGSDGLWNLIKSDEVVEIVNQEVSADKALRRLRDISRARAQRSGPDDNISILVLFNLPNYEVKPWAMQKSHWILQGRPDYRIDWNDSAINWLQIVERQIPPWEDSEKAERAAVNDFISQFKDFWLDFRLGKSSPFENKKIKWQFPSHILRGHLEKPIVEDFDSAMAYESVDFVYQERIADAREAILYGRRAGFSEQDILFFVIRNYVLRRFMPDLDKFMNRAGNGAHGRDFAGLKIPTHLKVRFPALAPYDTF